MLSYSRLGILALFFLTACREADRPLGPINAGIVVDSDPRGARILLDGKDTGLRTPDTLVGLTGVRHEVRVQLDTAGLIYSLAAQVELEADRWTEVRLPLLLRCPSESCLPGLVRYYEPNQMRFAAHPLGSLLLRDGRGGGVFWPATTQNSYASVGAPLFAGVIVETGDTVALGPYDWPYLAGRPAPEVGAEGGMFSIRQSAWVLPPSQVLPLATVRGIEIEQRVVGRQDLDGVVLIRLVFRNVTGDPGYGVLDPYASAGGGITFESAYVGFALDGDIGNADDDALSYAPELNLAFIYDGDFSEADFGGWANRPALIGVRVLEAPDGAQRVIMNGWPAAWDWAAGSLAEPAGWYWLSGEQARYAGPSDHPDPGVGFTPDFFEDMRVLVSAGPLRLEPGDSAALTLALVVAPPAEGSFTSGTALRPGDPRDLTHPLRRVAAPLFDRARAAEALR